jgi:hypothetical protein
MKIPRETAITLFATSLLGCSGQNPSDSSTANTITTPIASTADAIKAAEISGRIPTLNRDISIIGPDTDGNGVRDDIDSYINTLPDTSSQKAALRQASSALTKAMALDTTNQQSLNVAIQAISSAMACIYARFDSATAGKKVDAIEKLTINTPTRIQAYEKYNAAISGTTFVLPQGDGCASKP